MTAVSHGKPYAGNPHVRFEEGASESAKPSRKALLHKKLCMACLVLGAALMATAGAYRTHLKGSLIRERLDAPPQRDAS